VGHLNELDKKYAAKGLSIIAVTNEDKNSTEKFVEATRAEYAYAYDKGAKMKRYFGVRGIPHSVLIDPTGRVVWRGHPGRLTEKEIEANLSGALATPLWELGGANSKVKNALSKRKFAAAIEAAEDDPELAKTLAAYVDNCLKGLEDVKQMGDFLTAAQLSDRLADEFKGLAQGERAEAIKDEIKSSKEAKAVIKAQEKLLELDEEVRELTKQRDAEKLIKKIVKVRDSLPKTFAAKQAADLIKKIEDKEAKLK